ncbi:MAG: hypothetical protein GTO02_06730, partial [Candidatus Dadabacteria bacterium]|nr:hypothetical protein [Candidatus Dadabacteria bacterium]
MNNWYESAEGYWGKLEKNKEIIREWMRFHPCISTLTADLNSKKTAVGAEIACRQIRNQIKKEREEIDPYKLFDLYLKNKDPRIGQ